MRTNRGFIRAVVSIALALVVLKYAFGLDAFDVLRHPKVEPYLGWLYEWVAGIWEAYIIPAALWLWSLLVALWELAVGLWDRLTGGAAEVYDESKVFKE